MAESHKNDVRNTSTTMPLMMMTINEKSNTDTKNKSNNKKKKKKKHGKKRTLTKAERKEKYTNLARKKRDKELSKKRDQNLICFKCRKRGHAASNCRPSTNEQQKHMHPEHGGGGGGGDETSFSLLLSASAGGGPQGRRICYKCGSTKHRLQVCPKLPTNKDVYTGGRIDYGKIGPLPYADCYICGRQGHLASHCERNEGRGIYVKGGSCRICGSVEHLAAHCPENSAKNKRGGDVALDTDRGNEAVVDDLLEEDIGGKDNGNYCHDEEDNEQTVSTGGKQRRKRKKVVTF